MVPLYVVEQGATLHKDGERLVVRKEGRVLISIPAFKLDSVIVFGGVQITTQALSLLLANGIEVSFLTLNGHLKGRLLPTESRNILLRLRQYERYHEPAFRLQFSKAIVRGKLANARALITRHIRNHPDVGLESTAQALGDCLAQVDQTEDLPSLRGVEGRGTALYFSAVGKMVRSDLSFTGRTRRPPRDPVNALLSLGYSLLSRELFGLAAARGFDPYLGFYHDVRYGRPALALDLVEEFRPALVDRLVLSLVNRKVFAPEHFQPTEDGGCELTHDAFRRFLLEYEERVSTAGPSGAAGGWRSTFREQVGRLVQTVNSGAPYEPVRIDS
jgi:CRISPR-associated protein Cas1